MAGHPQPTIIPGFRPGLFCPIMKVSRLHEVKRTLVITIFRKKSAGHFIYAATVVSFIVPQYHLPTGVLAVIIPHRVKNTGEGGGLITSTPGSWNECFEVQVLMSGEFSLLL